MLESTKFSTPLEELLVSGKLRIFQERSRGCQLGCSIGCSKSCPRSRMGEPSEAICTDSCTDFWKRRECDPYLGDVHVSTNSCTNQLTHSVTYSPTATLFKPCPNMRSLFNTSCLTSCHIMNPVAVSEIAELSFQIDIDMVVGSATTSTGLRLLGFIRAITNNRSSVRASFELVNS